MLHTDDTTLDMSLILKQGYDFLRSGRIRKREKAIAPDGGAVIRAKLIDRFGFVMHPAVRLGPEEQLLQWQCNCDTKARLCPHCAALLYSLTVSVEPTIAPMVLLSDFVPLPDTPQTVLHRAVTVPVMQVPAAAIPSVQIPTVQIPAVQNPTAPVPAEEAPVGEAPAEAPDSAPAAQEPPAGPVFEPPGMVVRFGTDLGEKEPVEWHPNDTEQVFHTNTGIIGTMGTGKTQFTKSVIAQLVRESSKNFGGERPSILIFDYKGDYNSTKTDFVQATNARVLQPYRLPYNPLALTEPAVFKPLLPVHTANSFKDTLSKIYRMGPKQQQLLLDCILGAYKERGILAEDRTTWKRSAPTFADVYRRYTSAAEGRANDTLSAVMNKLAQFCIFEERPGYAGSFLELLKGVVVIDLSGYDPDIQSFVVAITLDQFYARMQSLGSSATDGRYRALRHLILVDEADNFIQEDFPSLRKLLKEGREFGVGTLLSTQSLSHFIGGDDDYSRYILTWVVHATADLKTKDVEYLFKLPPRSRQIDEAYTAIKRLQKHESVVKFGNNAPLTMRDLPFWQLMQGGDSVERETKA